MAWGISLPRANNKKGDAIENRLLASVPLDLRVNN